MLGLPCAANEEMRAERSFEFRDPPAQRRLGKVEALCRAAERLVFDDGHEAFQIAETKERLHD